jgi:hypothetical protein
VFTRKTFGRKVIERRADSGILGLYREDRLSLGFDVASYLRAVSRASVCGEGNRWFNGLISRLNRALLICMPRGVEMDGLTRMGLDCLLVYSI